MKKRTPKTNPNDIVARLRKTAVFNSQASSILNIEAAKEIERLRKRIIELEREIADADDERFRGGGAWNGDIP